MQFIKNNVELVKSNQQKRFANPNIIDEIMDLYNELNCIVFKYEQYKKTIKLMSTHYKQIEKNTNSNNISEDNILEIINDLSKIDLNNLNMNEYNLLRKRLDDKFKDYEQNIKNMTKKRDILIQSVGNILHKLTPIDNDEKNNPIIYIKNPNLENKKYNHIDLGKKLNIIDTENGTNIAGNRGYFFVGLGVKLNMALISYAMDFLNYKSYKSISTPHFVTDKLMSQITQLNDYQDTLYKLENEDKYLIATSEQPLTALFHNKIINTKELPIKYAGYSSCYRKETGAHGKQTRGIFRVHQFEKIEQFCVTSVENSWLQFDEMINISKEFYDQLGINYRVINIVSGALNNAASMKYDLEAWYPGSQFYGELVSCTNCLDYFSKRLNTKTNTGQTVHMLNCTLSANTRTICCILETYQTEKGVIIPDVLQKYMGVDFIPFVC
jgi:seryl-tRNA synthetase